MKLLTRDELKLAEDSLRPLLPKSQQVFGHIALMNRVEADPVEVMVDQWPDFNVLLVRPVRQEEADVYKSACFFAKDDDSLRNALLGSDLLDWTQYHCLGFDQRHEETIKAVAVSKGASGSRMSLCHMLTLQDPSHLRSEGFSGQVSSLKESHVALVNSTWKFSIGEFSERVIRNMILNFPSCCVLDSGGQPVAWILTYANGAMGILYTLPEHRGRGYAKALVRTMARKLHSEGYPVFCFVEEENTLSYELFISLGFTEDPSYRATWYSFNQALLQHQ
ncbi:glycine N-acyltransferase-like protein 3 [Hoplias malabaricus]|uniref:glycine N-acyltransferase-like protein 3 n=1 Tax=Hoplias malabaricus TaxID=27720 RepID=UPI0034631199